MTKKYFGGGDFRPTHPPADSEPVSRRHPGCWLCYGGGFITGMGLDRKETDSRVEMDSLPRGTQVSFVCHGRMDPTRIIHLEVELTDQPDIDDAPDGNARSHRDIRVISIDGMDEWSEHGIVFTAIRGYVEDAADYFRDVRNAGPIAIPGRFLVLRTQDGEDRVVRLPIAHIVVKRP